MQVYRHPLDHLVVVEHYGHPGRPDDPRQRAVVGPTSAPQSQPMAVHGQPRTQHRIGLADRFDPESAPDRLEQAASRRRQRGRVCVTAPVEITVASQDGQQHPMSPRDQRVEQTSRTRLATDGDVRSDCGRPSNLWRGQGSRRDRSGVVHQIGHCQPPTPSQQVAPKRSLLLGHGHRVDRTHSPNRRASRWNRLIAYDAGP